LPTVIIQVDCPDTKLVFWVKWFVVNKTLGDADAEKMRIQLFLIFTIFQFCKVSILVFDQIPL
jgi:hypothetical protein